MKNKKAFTMMELLVVITIIALVSVFTYTPYIYYKNKALVNFSTKTLAQSIYTARSLAIN
jgi:prepilin-type N-terminal cleavage/methylation domain-containing protein